MSKYIIHPQITLMTQIILDYYTRLVINYLRNPRNLRMKNQEATHLHFIFLQNIFKILKGIPHPRV